MCKTRLWPPRDERLSTSKISFKQQSYHGIVSLFEIDSTMRRSETKELSVALCERSATSDKAPGVERYGI